MTQEVESPEKQLARAVGAIIASRRKSKGLTQAELAEQMNIEKETISRIETGVISPTLSRLAQLAECLDCDMGELLRVESPELIDQARLLANKMENLSDSQRDLLVQLFGKMAIAMGKLGQKDRRIVEKFLLDII